MAITKDRQEEVRGTIEHIKFFENSFLIAVLDNGLTIKGSMIEPQQGIEYTFQGSKETHPRFGLQFSFTGYQTNTPTSEGAVLYYLSHNAKWIGPAVAKKAYDLYKDGTLAVLKDHPERVASDIKGMSLEHAQEASAMLKSNEANEKAVLDLREVIGDARVSQGQITQMLEHWRHEAAAYVRKYPYNLPDVIRGIGFHTADEIASRLGYDRNGKPRIEAGVLHCLKDGQRDGHVCLPVNILMTKAYELLGVSRAPIEKIIKEMSKGDKDNERKIVIDNDFIYSLASYDDEIYIADKIRIVLQALPSVHADLTVKGEGLFEDQKDALAKVKSSNVLIVTGAPGVGKSHMIKQIIGLFPMSHQVQLCAPTGKAAKRMYELTGKEARTVHSLLQPIHAPKGMEFTRNEGNPLDARIIICDEVSMMDNWLMASLLRAIEPGSRLVLVGDTNQLPAVGAGNVLKELIDSERVPFTELTEIKRQNPGLIVTNCHSIKNSIRDIEYEGALDFCFLDAETPEEISDIIQGILESVKKNEMMLFKKQADNYLRPLGSLDVLRDIQVITPLREKTELSVKALNYSLQKLLNSRARFVKNTGRYSYYKGDKVIQKKNEYDLGIINGDMGFVRGIDTVHKEIEVTFENPKREVILPMKDNHLELAYSITCHSYQGSEAPVVIIPIHSSFGGLIMQRNWLYTAISRAQKLCILIGQREEIPKIIGRNKQQFRYTQLAKKINPEIDEGW